MPTLLDNSRTTYTPLDLAYLAGLVDGEGSIGVYKNGPNRDRGSLTICMTTPDVLRWVESTFGGHLTGPYVDTRPNHSPTWTWRISAQRPLERMLVALSPHLRVKHEAAKDVLAFLASAPKSKTYQGEK